MDDVWDTIGGIVGWLDSVSTLPPEMERLLRIMKITEEAGEVAQAVTGTIGQNPRKGVTHTWDDVAAELCDVIFTSMVALTTLNPDAPKVFGEHLTRVAERCRQVQAAQGGPNIMADHAGDRPRRHTSVVDAHVILRRDGKILLLRRAGHLYAGGQLCLPSGHHDAGESITGTAAREAAEETGLALDPGGLRMVLAMHQRSRDGGARFGFFFEPTHWDGEPVNREPDRHTELVWADPASLPPDTVDYTAQAIRAIEQGRHFTVNGWEPAAVC
jgi:8-oxo-dGTP diphosphatase